MENHIKSDSNGKIIISKPFALITIIITLLIIAGQAVFASGVLNTRVETIEKILDEGIPIQREKIAELEEKIIQNKQDIVYIKAKLESIHEDIKEIKKELEK